MIPAYALYRRSRKHQDLSIEEQRAAVRGWAAEHGYAIVREFADDASGLHTERRRDFLSLLALCADAKTRAASTVLCYNVSRFGRFDPDEAAHWEYQLKQAGVSVVYTHDAGVNEAGLTGQLVKGLKRAMAHDYSIKLSQVISRGLRAHAALGHWTGGHPPYGFQRVVRQPDGSTVPMPAGRWKAKGETVVLEIEPVAAQIVEQIYRWAVDHGLGITAIADRLNRRGVPAPESLRRSGVVAWGKSTVRGILNNPCTAAP